MKKNILLSYSAPELDLYEVKVEYGFQNSPGDGNTQLPDFGTEEGGDLIY
jgi:hypothetical protein